MKISADVVELLSSQTTTQKLQQAHVRDPITVRMYVTANKRYDGAAIDRIIMAMLGMNGRVIMLTNLSLGWFNAPLKTLDIW